MATLTITVSNNAGEVSENLTMSEVNMGRFLAWALATHPTRDVVVDGEVTREPNTQVQAVRTALKDTLSGIKSSVLRHERNVAQNAVPVPDDLV